LNQKAPRFMPQELDVHPWASAEIYPGGQRRIFLILCMLLTMQCKNAFPFPPHTSLLV